MKKMKIRRMGLIGIIIIGLLLVLAPGAWAQQGKSPPEKAGKTASVKPTEGKQVKPTEGNSGKPDEGKPSKTAEEKPGEQPKSPQDVLVINAPPGKPFEQATDYVISFPLKEGGPKGVKALFIGKDGLTLAAPVPPETIPGKVTVKIGDKLIHEVEFTPVKETGVLMQWLPVIFFLAFLVFLVIALGVATYKKKWSLSDALSEYLEVKEVFKIKDDQEHDQVVYKQGSPEPVVVTINKPTCSASRLIAFIGLFGIITWTMVILCPAVQWFARTGHFPKLEGLSTFLVAQAGIFTPYIANRIGAAIKGS